MGLERQESKLKGEKSPGVLSELCSCAPTPLPSCPLDRGPCSGAQHTEKNSALLKTPTTLPSPNATKKPRTKSQCTAIKTNAPPTTYLGAQASAPLPFPEAGIASTQSP